MPSRLAGVGLYEITLTVTLVIVLGQFLVRRSRVGRRFFCLKTSERARRASLGVSPYRTKVMALLVSAVPAGLAGAFYLASQQFISPDSVSTTLSINVLEAIVLGGIASTWGPIAGTVLVVALPRCWVRLRQYSGIITGLILLAVVRAAPEGLAGTSWMRRLLGRGEHHQQETGFTSQRDPDEGDAVGSASHEYMTDLLTVRGERSGSQGDPDTGTHPDLVVADVTREVRRGAGRRPRELDRACGADSRAGGIERFGEDHPSQPRVGV